MKKMIYFASAVVYLIIFSYSNAVADFDSLPFATKYDRNFSVNLGGPTCFASISFNKYITPNVESEVGLGFYGAFIGSKYHWWVGPSIDEEYLSPYIGLYYSRSVLFNPTIPLLTWYPVNSVYAPLGLQFYGREHFNIAIEIAAVKVDKDYTNNKYGIFPYWGLKIGYYF